MVWEEEQWFGRRNIVEWFGWRSIVSTAGDAELAIVEPSKDAQIIVLDLGAPNVAWVRVRLVAVDLCMDRSRGPRTRYHLARCNASTLAATTTANGSRCAMHSLPLWRGAIGCRRSLHGSFAWVTHSQPPGAVQRSGRNRSPATTASVAAAQAYRRAFFNGSPSLALPLVPMGQQLGGSTPWWRCRWCPWASSRLGWALP